jgi:hypothetical protein
MRVQMEWSCKWYFSITFHRNYHGNHICLVNCYSRKYVCMYYSGAGFPMHCDLCVVYCTSPVNFKSAAIPSRHDGTTYQRTVEPSPSGGIDDYVLGREMSTILLRSPLGTWGSLTCSESTTRVKRLKVPPGGLVPWIFPSLKIRRPPPGLNPRHSGHEVGTLPLDHGGRLQQKVNSRNYKNITSIIIIIIITVMTITSMIHSGSTNRTELSQSTYSSLNLLVSLLASVLNSQMNFLYNCQRTKWRSPPPRVPLLLFMNVLSWKRAWTVT